MKIRLTDAGLLSYRVNGRTGWKYTDAVLLNECPKCHARKEHHCRTPAGRKAWPPHDERLQGVVANKEVKS